MNEWRRNDPLEWTSSGPAFARPPSCGQALRERHSFHASEHLHATDSDTQRDTKQSTWPWHWIAMQPIAARCLLVRGSALFQIEKKKRNCESKIKASAIVEQTDEAMRKGSMSLFAPFAFNPHLL